MSAEKLMKLFEGLHRAHGTYVLFKKQEGKKQQGQASTVAATVTALKWQAHLDGKLGLGIVPIKDDATCRWGAIDVDVYPLDIPQLEAQCKALNLPLVPCRTKSGGAHLFMFLKPDVQASLVRSRLMEFAFALGYPGVEVFPKQVKLASELDVGNWLNMPYYDEKKTERYAIIGGKPATLEQFLQRAAKITLSAEQLESVKLASADFDDGPPCLQALSKNGFPLGTRNNGLFATGVYARMKFETDWEQKLEEYNRTLLGQPLPAREVTLIIKSLNKKKYFYPCEKQPCVNFCNKALCRTKKFGIGTDGNDAFDIQIGQLVKIDTDPPTWITSVDGIRFSLETEDLLSQARFRKICVDRINRLPSKIKPTTWEKLVVDLLAKVEVQSAPKDAGVEGQFTFLVEQFCTSVSQAREQDELLAGKPWTDNGRTYFRSRDLSRFMDQQRFYDMPAKRMWAVLRNLGATHHQFQVKGKCVQCWSIAEFGVQKEDLKTPTRTDT